MQRRRHECQLVEIVQILELAVSAVVVEVANIRRAIHRYENGILAADADRALGIARVEGEFRWHLGDQSHQQVPVDPDAGVLYIGPGCLPHFNGFVVAKLAAHLFQDREDASWISSTASFGTIS